MVNSPAWLYDEFQQTGTDFEDAAQVAVYDRNQSSSTPQAEQELLTKLGLASGDTVIDFGCGTGTFAIQAALMGAQVHAVDVSQAMLNYAQQKAKTAGVFDRIQFHHHGFLTYEHDTPPVDFIITKSALHHLPDFWKMVALLRMALMLKDGGMLYLRDAIFSFDPADYRLRINAWIERVAKPPGAGWTTQDFETHVREEYTTFGWIVEQMLTQSGFDVEIADYPTSEYAEYICRKRISTNQKTHLVKQQAIR